MNRTAKIERKTQETEIFLSLNLDGTGIAKLDYPIGFLRHMINTFAKHGLFDIELRASGDLCVDQHHLVEDTGITLGQAFSAALADKKGIRRVGSCLYPMDETLARAAVDLSGRPYLCFDCGISGIPLVSAEADGRPAPFQTDTIADFWQGFTGASACALHLDVLRGRSDHHKIEAVFKAAARALRAACEKDPRAADAIPSTKGCLPPPVYLA
ncbi:MAG: imidazoleglycerol-phosphate dehydratase HisB [Spirochaetaceae bacterium]|jgi:imidazoleglycerol-phosphate dehydratase|nr:imidazoleglycerol-phosphate dehydratase HisB [Spirochaetaceae bacterium]